MSLRDILRDLSAKHSLIQMHTELLSMMKEEYAALKEFFAPSQQEQEQKSKPKQKKGAVEEPVVVASPSVASPAVKEQEKEKEQAQTTESLRVIANTKIRIVKKEALPEPEPEIQEESQEQKQEQTQTSKDLKAWQKEQEQKKLAQLTAQGVNPETLLTVDSIKKWILDEKRTFAYVAREYLGMPESKVADFARKHNVKSTISKNRAIIAAKKH
jgi:hypothetical protein